MLSEKEEEELMGTGVPDSAETLRSILPGYDRKVPTYQPPVFSGDPGVFYDLVSYAPAMRTNLADVLAVLEAEARGTGFERVPLGKIDDGARRLIERARGAGWQTATIADPHGKTPLTVAFDGTGRYRYERTTSAGLREQVLCDGTSLWHLYPELGIGAPADAEPLPSPGLRAARALGPASGGRPGPRRGRGERRRADRGHRAAGTHGQPGNRRTPGGGTDERRSPRPLGERLRTHLVFAPDGRLAERQLVEMPSGKILARESYAADGTVEFVDYEKKDAGGTPAPQRKIELAPCGAPELKPDADLVVLPLPLRSRQQVLATRKLFSDDAYGSWSEEDALAVIAADLGDVRLK